MLILRAIDDLAYEDLALALEVPVGTVRSRLSRARAALRKLLEEEQTATPPTGSRGSKPGLLSLLFRRVLQWA
ncbi:hypothetical protein DYH09_35395 [bacterium CPR1]|nr:hypothetical protein [bacterium CPR1]